MSVIVGGFVLALVNKLTGEFATIAAVAVSAYSASNAFVHKEGSK